MWASFCARRSWACESVDIMDRRIACNYNYIK
jgi:hypothetical protein